MLCLASTDTACTGAQRRRHHPHRWVWGRLGSAACPEEERSSPLPGAAPALLERRHRGAAWNAPATAIRDWPKASATSPLDAFEAYVDLRWGQGLVYDAGFVESHVAVRRERDDQQHDLWRWRGWTRAARASRSSATMPAARGLPRCCSSGEVDPDDRCSPSRSSAAPRRRGQFAAYLARPGASSLTRRHASPSHPASRPTLSSPAPLTT
jgi:hypothetical protein